ncbi:DNA-binding IclR family transcriptional regulator [Arthrobacter pigmenti]|uniref:Glycerol operon regulatory protein n=1 Tax=Arthrobacter pigmenti TaxID=271432 RepID=A0A846RQW2_9MICC|nr:IclR family transcriptional regulator [Arthrobacter pigmenti]NJC21486.1 DNA-binding IclR family transcriptional regulator [Arthrobacter pigmenti]
MVSDNGFVRSVERVAALLELLSERKSPMRMIEVAQALDLPKSTTHGLLQTLQAKELVVRDDNQRYRLSLRLFSLAATALELVDLPELARPAMEELSGSTGGTCNLAVLDGHYVLYIEKVEHRDSLVRLVTHVGTRIPAHVTALGKVLVAALPEADQKQWLTDHVFERMTDHTITDADDFRKDLLGQAKRGYALDNQELHSAITGFAAPVRDHTGTVVAALSLTYLGSSMNAGEKRGLGAQVVQAADTVSTALSNR